MSEQKILIPIKASEELPDNDRFYFITVNGVLALAQFNGKFWEGDEGFAFYNKEVNWYKPVSIDELLPSEEELNKQNETLFLKDYLHLISDDYKTGCKFGQIKLINYIKNKLTNTKTMSEQKTEENKIRLCPNCKKYTEQKVTLYNPDDEDGMEVWECLKCHEQIDFI